MDLIDRIKQLSQRVSKIKETILTEEATKMSLIVPFFQILGYDVFDPEEFLPEFTADVGIKKGEKVDYAIMINGEPTILVECKWCGEPLEKHDSQLFRYFGASTAKFAILTNGIVYKFYTDLDETNKMDLTPFLELDLENIKESVIPEIKKFQKGNFDPENMMNAASELKYSKAIKDFFESQLKSPSDSFIKYYLSQVYDGVKTQSVIEKFSPIVKKALNDYISEKMNEKIKTALASDSHVDDSVNNHSVKNDETEADDHPMEEVSKVFTTQEELEAFYAIKSILADTVDLSRLSYKDTESYFAIIIDNKVTCWICRIKLDGAKKHILLRNEDKSVNKIYINGVNDLFSYKSEIVCSASKFA